VTGDHPRIYLRTGGIQVALSLSGGAALLGWIDSPYLILSLASIPAGLLLLAAGTGRLPRSGKSGIGLRVSFLGIAFSLFLLGSWIGVATGAPALRTSMIFCAMAASYLDLLSAGLLVAGAMQGKRAT
jgi:hypothetical protein